MKKPMYARPESPRTDEFIHRIQTESIPFHQSFFELLEFTRTLEHELIALRKLQQRQKRSSLNIRRQERKETPQASETPTRKAS